MADSKLQELIETLKKHGVESGEEAARKIIDEANRQQAEILRRAKEEAERIVAEAKSEADKRSKQLQSSLEIAASQFIANLKRAIEENFLVLPLKNKLIETLGDTKFLQELLKTVVQEYTKNTGHRDVVVLLSKEQQEKLRDFALNLAATRPGKKEKDAISFTIEGDGVNFGFTVSTRDGNVRLDFTDEAFLSLFLRFLSPRFRELFKNIKIGEMSGK
jgi:V/A-type H+-transporting ATPase subunit E